MTNPKRLTVLIIVALWCLCSLPFAHAQQCSEDQYASNTIVIKKKAAGGGCDTGSHELIIDNITDVADTSSVNCDADTWMGGKFALTADTTVTQYIVTVKKVGAETGTGTCEIYNHIADGGAGHPDETNPVANTVASISIPGLQVNPTAETMVLDGDPVLVPIGTYWLVCKGGTAMAVYRGAKLDSAACKTEDSGTNWTDYTTTMKFMVYGCD